MRKSSEQCQPVPTGIGAAALLATLLLSAWSVAPAHAAVVQEPDSVTIVPGARYAGGGLRRALLGDHYRDIWTTPITVAVLDLDEFAGGLEPISSHLGSQTRSLRFRGADGRTYQFRSVFKTPTSVLRPELQNTLVADLLQDGASASHPLSTLIVDPLLEAAGVLHPEPHLFVMPSDARLGEFRDVFEGMLGVIEERPNEGVDGVGGFGRAIRVIGPDRLFERIDEGPEDRVDVRGFLVARLMDILMGDRDRHRDNWRWALLDDSGPTRTWVPISRDHDEAFVKLDGTLLHLATAYYPQLTSFAPEYSSAHNLNWHAREVDRRFLAGLELSTWDSAAAWVQEQLTDAVIDEAVARMPRAMIDVGGAELASTLRARRDDLREEARRYYSLLARTIEIRASDAAELLEVVRVDDRFLDVTLGAVDDPAGPYLVRRFDARETDEVRVRLWGGRDRAVVTGPGANPIRIRIVGGSGRDELADSSRAGGVSFYDQGDGTVFHGGPGTKIDRRPYEEWVGSDLDRYPPREWGSWSRWYPSLSAGPNFGVMIGATYRLTRYGFRKSPYGSRIDIGAGFATGDGWGRVHLESEHHFENSTTRADVDASVSGIDILRFYGVGNDSEPTGSSRLHTVELTQIKVEPELVVTPRPELELSAGPFVRFSRTGSDESPFFASIEDTLYGAGSLGRVGASAGVRWDSRDREVASTKGVVLDVHGEVVPALLDVHSMYGRISGEARTYLTAASWLEPTLALRLGADRLLGTAPFQELAFIGGRSTLRGWSSERFAGDAAVYGSAELRLRVGGFRAMLPADLGVFGLFDVGRVYVDGTSPGGWHTGAGGGLWFAFVDRASTISIGLASGEERTALYATLGFGF